MHKPKEKLAGVVTDMTLELLLLSLELPIWPHRMCVKVWDERERQIVGGGMKCVSNFFFFLTIDSITLFLPTLRPLELVHEPLKFLRLEKVPTPLTWAVVVCELNKIECIIKN